MARRQNRAGETEEQAMKVADIHAHIFPEKLADKAPASISAFYGGMDVACHPATAENLVKFEHEAGITRFVMSNSATSAHQVRSINDFLPQAVKDVPGAIAFGSIFPGMDGAEEELERAKALGIRGLKVHPDFQKVPIDEPCGVPAYRKAAKLGLPVLYGGQPVRLLDARAAFEFAPAGSRPAGHRRALWRLARVGAFV